MTYKSDDVIGRVKVYESIIKGQEVNQAGVPESFRVLMKEFQALGLDVSFVDDEGESHQLKDIEDEEEKEDNPLSIEDVESPVKKVEEEREDGESTEEEMETTEDSEELFEEEIPFEDEDMEGDEI